MNTYLILIGKQVNYHKKIKMSEGIIEHLRYRKGIIIERRKAGKSGWERTD